MNIINIPLPAGRSGLNPEKAIVHCMAEYVIHEGRSYHAIEWLRKKGLSAHLFVTPSCEVIRSRNDDQVAWHAKAHSHNFKTVGIEFLVPGAYDYAGLLEKIKHPYLLPGQLEAGIEACRQEWVDKLGILNFAEHSKIDPLNKQDPGDGFPWREFLKGIGVITY